MGLRQRRELTEYLFDSKRIADIESRLNNNPHLETRYRDFEKFHAGFARLFRSVSLADRTPKWQRDSDNECLTISELISALQSMNAPKAKVRISSFQVISYRNPTPEEISLDQKRSRQAKKAAQSRKINSKQAKLKRLKALEKQRQATLQQAENLRAEEEKLRKELQKELQES